MARQTRSVIPNLPLSGVRMLITAGPTHEYIDDVRFIGNPSTGRMGLELARAAQKLGANVTVVCGPTNLQAPVGVAIVPVVSAQDMLAAVEERFADCNVFIATAAVSDYRPESRFKGKLKKKKDKIALNLVRNPDILRSMGKRRREDQLVIGFSLEVDNALDFARGKLTRKNCNVMIVTTPANFGDSREAVRVINNEGVIAEVPPSSKSELADYLCQLLCELLEGKVHRPIIKFPKSRPGLDAKPSKRERAGGGDS